MKKKNHLSFSAVFVLLVATIAMRVNLELFAFDFPIQLDVFQDYVRFYLENIYYFLIVFILSGALIARVTKAGLLEVMNFGVRFYPVILLPPVIDGFLLGRREGYYYATVQNLGWNFFSLSFIKGDATLGISVEILIALIGVFTYVYLRTKNLAKSFLVFFLIDLLLVIISTPDLFFGAGRGDYRFDFFLPFYYFFPFLVTLVGVLWAYNRKCCVAVLANFRLVRSAMFVLAVFLGGLIQSYSSGEMDLLNMFYSMCAVFLLWQVSVIVNDISDVKIDKLANKDRPLVRGVLTAAEYHLAGIFFSFTALSFAVVVSLKVLLLSVVALVFAYGYSFEPIRLRKNFLGNLIIGLSLFVCFWIGVLSSGESAVTSGMTQMSTFILVFGVFISLAKDIKDVDGDEAGGVKNVFTVFGKNHAKTILLALIFIVFNIPTVVYGIFITFLLSLMAWYVYNTFESIRSIYLLSAAVIINILFAQYPAILFSPPLDFSQNVPNVVENKVQNYVEFLDSRNNVKGRIYEINALILLENIFRQRMELTRPSYANATIADYDTLKDVFGWWPAGFLKDGKVYFVDGPTLYLHGDIDATVWKFKLNRAQITEDTARRFLAPVALPGKLQDICREISCKKGMLLRISNYALEQDEIDLTATANAVSSLDGLSMFNKEIIRENARLINHVIENHDYQEFIGRIQPRVAAITLLLFYDKEYNSYLTNRSRRILMEDLKKYSNDLTGKPLRVKLNRDNAVFYGLSVESANKTIPQLMRHYVQAHFLGQ